MMDPRQNEVIATDDETAGSEATHPDLFIRYGDIVVLIAPNNVQLHEHTFFVDYVDKRQIRVIQVTSLEITTLYLTDTGQFRDESITGVDLVSRANERGYARQSGLVPHTWVKVEFGGEYPAMVVGEITNSDEDQIEITTHPSREVLYIDFAYQGLPLDLHIVSVRTIEAPPGAAGRRRAAGVTPSGELIESIDDVDLDADAADEHVPELSEDAADPTVRATLHELYIDANDIVFGPSEDDVLVGQVVEISEHEKVYSVESQLNDLLDELLSTIPNPQRTTPVMARVHRLLERFRELRSQYSRFAGSSPSAGLAPMSGRVLGPQVRTALDRAKPLLKHLGTLDRLPAWLVPVVHCRRKIYDVAKEAVGNNAGSSTHAGTLETSDVELLNQRISMVNMENRQKDYALDRGLNHPNRVPYVDLQNSLEDALTPFVAPTLAAGTTAAFATQVHVLPQEAVVGRTSVVRGISGEVDTATFVPQRFLPADPRAGKLPRTSPETMYVTSWIALCRSWVEFSRVRLPTTDILRRVSWGANWPMQFMRFARLGPSREFDTVTLAANTNPTEAEAALPSTDKQYVLESPPPESSRSDPEAFQGMVPSVSALIHNLPIPTSVSLAALVARLEPYLVYGEDLDYSSYQDARKQVQTRVKTLRERLREGRTACEQWRNHRFRHEGTQESNVSNVSTMLGSSSRTEFPHMVDHLLQGYRSLESRSRTPRSKSSDKEDEWNIRAVSSSELWSSVWNEDGAHLLSLLLQAMYVNLQIPASFYAASGTDRDDMDALEKIKPTDCARRVLVKKYTALGDLQKDNHEEIYVDRELDDTPYGLLKTYEAAQKTQTREAFETYLAENLVQKHGCPRNQSLELARTLLQGKKQVRDGEYAVLSIRPQLAAKSSETNAAVPTQDYRTRNTYYQRTRGVWVKNDALNRGDEELAFVDSNTLFCQLQPGCVKTSRGANVCADLNPNAAAARIPTDAAREELATRLANSMDEIVRDLETRMETQLRLMTHATRLRAVQQERQSNYAWTLGKHAAEITGLVSPAATLRDTILAETDVALRAHHVVALVDYYARSPMAEEDPHWYYCVETNTRFLPAFVYELARAFTIGGTSAMADAMARIEQRQGVLSDDCDSIVDKYSGYVIRRIDLVVEEEFDDITGLRISTHQVLTADSETETALAADATRATAAAAASRTFKSPLSRDIHRLYVALCYQNMGIERSDPLEDFVIRIVEAQLRSEATHQILDMERKESFAVLIAATLLVGIQTTVPPIRPRKTFPGCVQSFHGFPLGGVEDLSTIAYVSCVMAVQDPSILALMKRSRLEDQIRNALTGVLLELPEVKQRYEVRREYDAQHISSGREGSYIPAVHALSRTWRTFLPPQVKMDAEALAKTLRPVEADQAKYLQDLMRRGNREQFAALASLAGKSMRHGYGICAGVHAVVGAQASLLHTESQVPFLQNACCNNTAQTNTTTTALTYFETVNPDVRKYRGVIEHIAKWLDTMRSVTTPSLLFDPRDTRIRRTDVPLDYAFGLRSIYQAFITHGHFDRPDVPIPDDLAGIIPDKPATPDYPVTGTLDEKMAAIQRAGKHYNTEQLDNLLQAIFRRRQLQRVNEDPNANAVTVASRSQDAAAAPMRIVSALVDFLDHLDLDVPALKAFDPPLRNHLLAVLAQYQPGRMIHEDSVATTALKNYLQVANQKVREELTNFIRTNCGVKEAADLDAWLTEMIAPLSNPLLDADYLYTLTRFLQTSVKNMGEVYPGRIVAGAFSSYTVPAHWDLSEKHENDLTRVVEQYSHRLKAFVGDSMLPRVFTDVAPTCGELSQFLQYLPVRAPLISLPPSADSHSDAPAVPIPFYDIFDTKTTLLLHWHVWYSVLYTYMQSVADGNLANMDIRIQKKARRAAGRDDRDPTRLRAADTANSDYVPEYADPIVAPREETRQEAGLAMDEIVIESDQKLLNARVANLMWTYVTLDRDLYQIVGQRYPTIIQTFQALRDAEKRRVVNHFRDMTAEERRVEYQLKEHRLGYWNVDVQRGVVAYDKDVYDLEMQQLQEQRLRVRDDMDDDGDNGYNMTGGGERTKTRRMTKIRTSTNSMAPNEPWDHPAVGLDVYDLERYERTQVEAEYDREEHNIQHYGEDYLDGNYYGGDDDDDLDFPYDE
jgi:hypothetical protein